MNKIISVEKEFMDIPLWIKNPDGVFLPMDRKMDGILNKMHPSTMKKLIEYSKKWENIQKDIIKTNHKSVLISKLNKEVLMLEDFSRDIALELKEQFPINYKFCYWSESKMERIFV